MVGCRLCFAMMVYQRCTEGVLLFYFFHTILIIARKVHKSLGFDLRLFFFGRMRLSSFHASVHTKGVKKYYFYK